MITPSEPKRPSCRICSCPICSCPFVLDGPGVVLVTPGVSRANAGAAGRTGAAIAHTAATTREAVPVRATVLARRPDSGPADRVKRLERFSVGSTPSSVNQRCAPEDVKLHLLRQGHSRFPKLTIKVARQFARAEAISFAARSPERIAPSMYPAHTKAVSVPAKWMGPQGSLSPGPYALSTPGASRAP